MTSPWIAAITGQDRPLDLLTGRVDLPGEALGPRTLDLHVLFLMRSGGYDGEIGGRPVRVRAGDLLWLRPGVPHRLVSNGPLRKYFLRLRLDAPAPAGPPIRRLGDEAEAWCAALFAEQHAGDAARDIRIRALLALLFTAWDRAGAARAGGLPADRRARLLQAVHDRPDRRWTRAELARAVGVGGLHLARQVRRTFGLPLRRWLVETRIRAAARDLRDSADPIAAVAARHGYAEPFLFSRQFRSVMGVSPRSWRRDEG